MNNFVFTVEGFEGLRLHPVRWIGGRLLLYAGSAVIAASLFLFGSWIYSISIKFKSEDVQIQSQEPIVTERDKKDKRLYEEIKPDFQIIPGDIDSDIPAYNEAISSLRFEGDEYKNRAEEESRAPEDSRKQYISPEFSRELNRQVDIENHVDLTISTSVTAMVTDNLSDREASDDRSYDLSREKLEFSWPVEISKTAPIKFSEFIEKRDVISIPLLTGSRILAAESGIVTYREGEFSKSKSLIIVTHANGLFSRYEFIGEVWVKVGDYVKRGHPIGVSDQEDESKLEFAVLKNNRPINIFVLIKKSNER